MSNVVSLTRKELYGMKNKVELQVVLNCFIIDSDNADKTTSEMDMRIFEQELFRNNDEKKTFSCREMQISETFVLGNDLFFHDIFHFIVEYCYKLNFPETSEINKLRINGLMKSMRLVKYQIKGIVDSEKTIRNEKAVEELSKLILNLNWKKSTIKLLSLIDFIFLTFEKWNHQMKYHHQPATTAMEE